MAQGSAVAERYVRETVVGTTPVDSTNWQGIPLSGDGGLSAQPVKVESNRVRSDRGRSAGSVVGFDINGAYAPFSFKADQVDDYFEMVCANTFGAVTAGVLTNGSALQTATVEREFTDETNKFIQYKGATVSQLDMDFATVRQEVTLTPTFVAMTSDNTATASLVGAGSVVAETTNRSLTVGDVSNLTLDAVGGYCITSGTLSIVGNVDPKLCAGSFDAVELTLGQFALSLSMTLETTDDSWALLAKRDAGDTFPVAFDISDGTNTYSFVIPDVQAEFPDPNATTENESVTIDLSLEAYQADGSYTIQITKS